MRKTTKYRGGQVRGLRNKGNPNKSINVTFSGTQEPNPILVRGGPIPQPIIQTRVGGIILNFIRSLNDKLEDVRIQKDDEHIAKKLINMSEKMLEYPESSNLENYVLFSFFLELSDVERLLSAINDVLKSKPSRLTMETPFDFNSLIQYPNTPSVTGKIDPLRFFSLMILSSRLCSKSKVPFSENPECELFKQLNNLFDGGNGENFTSDGISQTIETFIRTSKMVTPDYLKQLLNGERVYKIYKDNYLSTDKEISKNLIIERLNKWVAIVPISEKIMDIPVSYLFNKFTNREKELMNKNTEMCKTISENTDAFGKRAIAKPLLPRSVFNIEQNDNVDFDKINEFLHKLSPAPVQKKIKKQQIKKQQIKNKTQIRSLDKKGMRGTRKIR